MTESLRLARGPFITSLIENGLYFLFQFDAINGKVRQPLAHIQHACKGPEKLISKRGDKLLDYESVAAKLEKVETGGTVDSTKIAAVS